MRFPVLYGLWVGMYVRAEHADALQQAEILVDLTKASVETAPAVVANRMAGMSHSFLGNLTRGQNHFEHALSLYDPVAHKGLENRFGQDIGEMVHCYLALNLALLGETRRAEMHAAQAKRIALATGHANTICHMHMHLAMLGILCDAKQEVKWHTEAMAPLAEAHNLTLWDNYGALFRAVTKMANGDPNGLEDFQEAYNVFIASKSRLYLVGLRTEAGCCALALGLRDKAHELASQAQNLVDETGEVFALSKLHGLKGALALDRGDVHVAETCLRTALDVARQQGAKLWELGAAIDLARLMQEQGRTDEAIAILKPVSDSIAEGDCPGEQAVARELLSVLKR